MKKKEKYYGIKFNDEIPRLDKINQYNKQVKIQFEGQAYTIKRKNNETIKEEIQNNDILKKEKKYEIEFTNNENKTFLLQVRIKNSYLFFILLLFFIVFVTIVILIRPITNKISLVDKFYNYINLSIIQFDIDHNQEAQYYFEVNFQNISSNDINIKDTISAKSVAKNKIAPGIKGTFSIILSTKNSNVDMNYKINFKDLNHKKPDNMRFKIRGSNQQYSSLQNLENDLKGLIKKHSKKIIIIEWEWPYETGKNKETIMTNDKIDTDNGEKLENYKFKINVIGEEVI